jgi:hypothetical protein
MSSDRFSLKTRGERQPYAAPPQPTNQGTLWAWELWDDSACRCLKEVLRFLHPLPISKDGNGHWHIAKTAGSTINGALANLLRTNFKSFLTDCGINSNGKRNSFCLGLLPCCRVGLLSSHSELVEEIVIDLLPPQVVVTNIPPWHQSQRHRQRL